MPLPTQMNSLLLEINSLDLVAVSCRAEKSAVPEDWAPGCWSSILYHQPKDSTKPPVDPSETFVITTALHVLENASVWSKCKEMRSISLSGFDGDIQLLDDALNCLKSIPGSFGLSLRGKLVRLPENLFDLRQLTELNIGSMGLMYLPDRLSDLQQLEALNAQRNAFREFPSAIKDLHALKKLSIWGHAIGAIPDWFGELSGLEALLIGQCELSAIPQALWLLTNLKTLDVSNNPQLTSLSSEIGKLTKLEVLKLSGCGLTDLPDELADLPELREVFVPNNKLGKLPEKLWGKPLDTLSVSGNGLQQPPQGVKAKQLWI